MSQGLSGGTKANQGGQNLNDSRYPIKIAVGDSECGDDVTGLLVRERCNLDILSVKNDAKLSASEMPAKEEGNDEEDLQCSSLFIVCPRRSGLAEAEEKRLE